MHRIFQPALTVIYIRNKIKRYLEQEREPNLDLERDLRAGVLDLDLDRDNGVLDRE